MSKINYSFRLSPHFNEVYRLASLVGCIEEVERYFDITFACAVETDSSGTEKPIFFPDLEDANDAARMALYDGNVVPHFFRKANGTVHIAHTHAYRFDIQAIENHHLTGVEPFRQAKITKISRNAR